MSAIRPRSQRGFALVMVLVALALLAVLVGAIAAGGRGEARLAANLRAGAMAEAAADGAVQQAAFHLLAAGAAHWPADGAVRRILVGGVPVAVRVSNEAGKVNPNLASPALMTALLQAVGADSGRAAAIASAIRAWRTPDAADAAPYVAAGRDYGPPGAKLQSLDELALVADMTPALLARLLPHLSLARDRPPDPAAADPVVARALAAIAGPQAAAPPPSGASVDLSVVRVVAVALGPGGARFVRDAVLRLAPGRADAPLSIMTWDAPPIDAQGWLPDATGQL